MRRLRGVAASARVIHSTRSALQTEQPSGAFASAPGVEGATAEDAEPPSDSMSLSSFGSSSSLNGSSSSLPLLRHDEDACLFGDDHEEEQRARDLIRRWKETRAHLKVEKGELLRSLLLLFNVLAQIVLTVAALEYQWDGVTLRNSNVSLGIRTAVSVLTGLLVVQMVEDDAWKIWKDAKDMRKRAKHAKEERRKGRIGAAVGEVRRQLTHRRFYMPIGDEVADFSFRTPTWMILMEYLPFRFYLLFTVRVLLCLPHIAPILDDEMTKLAAMLTFLKLFVAMSVLRHFNPIYRDRHLIIRIPGSSLLEMPRFTTWFSTRTFYHQYPLTFSLTNIIAVVAITAYGMYIYEREAQPHLFTFKICFVMALENLITGWPGDVFSQYNLESDGGKSFSIFASLGGLFFFALLINFLYIKLSPSSNDSHVVDWIARLKLEDKEKHEAAKLIQLVWRRRMARKRREEEELERVDHERHFHFITVPSEKAYQVRFRRQCREMRHVRRKLVELYGRTGDGLETHPAPVAKKSKKEKEKEEKKKKGKHSKDKSKAQGHRQRSRSHGNITNDEFLLEQQQEEWEAQRERLKKFYAKAAKNLNKIMAELER